MFCHSTMLITPKRKRTRLPHTVPSRTVSPKSRGLSRFLLRWNKRRTPFRFRSWDVISLSAVLKGGREKHTPPSRVHQLQETISPQTPAQGLILRALEVIVQFSVFCPPPSDRKWGRYLWEDIDLFERAAWEAPFSNKTVSLKETTTSH